MCNTHCVVRSIFPVVPVRGTVVHYQVPVVLVLYLRVRRGRVERESTGVPVLVYTFVVDSFGWIEEDAHGWFRKNIVAKFRGPAHVAYYGPMSVPSEATAWASLSAIIHCAVAAHTFRSRECAAPPADAT